MLIIGGVGLVVIVCLFLLFRAMGSMRRPSPRERMRHSADQGHGPGPRAGGLD